ncbi:hypothetical protein Hanom_Chr09g00772081 [Helianthus anomalus]
MVFKINKTSSKQEFIIKVSKQENNENREIRPEESSFLRSVLQPDDSCKPKRSENRKICSENRLRDSDPQENFRIRIMGHYGDPYTNGHFRLLQYCFAGTSSRICPTYHDPGTRFYKYGKS